MARSRFTALVPTEQPERKYGPANKYDPEHCWTVRQLGQEGKFPEEWVAELGVTLSTLYHWANAFPEFEQAMHEAHWLCRAYWAKKARENIQGVGIPPSTLSLILQRRFPDMWGKNSVNLHEHFEDRNKSDDPDAVEDTSPEALRAMSREDLQERIRALEARRKHEEET